ncbi:MAG TPA: pantoate--beta-alanine ligase [Myxococcaceae bacterium]|nr:pantoate--beta-alanine ligase [Myxococcaceae bacterium]
MALAVVRTTDECRCWTEGARLAGRKLALIPTMGYLHQGHLALIAEGRARADVAGVSIFVNPIQFGPREDLSRYPRDLEGDLEKCERAGAELVFAPTPEEMYPQGFQTFVEVTEVSRGLCGDVRPGHFRGVATVVSKLFTVVRPQLAVFGEKDYQQLQVIRALNRDLGFGIEIVGVPTVREPDGLAMSSRNAYLSAEERPRALSLWRGLQAARALARQGVRDVRELTNAIRRELEAANVRPDYVEVVDATSLVPLSRFEPEQPARALVAGYVGQTRLIDNLALNG